MRANVRTDTNTILIEHWARRQEEAALLDTMRARTGQRDGELELVGMLVFFGLLLTLILLVLFLPGSPRPH